MITLSVNGQKKQFPDGLTLARLLELENIPSRYVAIELSGRIVARGDFGSVCTADGDSVEILRPIGGG